MRLRLALILAALLPAAAWSQPQPSGFLCCNLRTDGKWISDINYQESGKRIVPVGTPAAVTGYGRYRVHVDLGDGSKQSIGNDYSRDLDMGAFAQRYVVTDDPRKKIAGFPPKVREAIESARLTKGMTREQVFMAVGLPVSSENPRLDAKELRFWLWSFSEFRVTFDANDRVQDISADAETTRAVVMP